MNALTVFEERKQEFGEQLAAAQDAQARTAAAGLILEQISCILAQEENDPLMRQRRQAALALCRRAPSLLSAADAQGELVIAAKTPPTKQQKLSIRAAGAGLLMLLGAHSLLSGDWLYALLQLAGVALAAFGSGMLPALPGTASHAQARGVLHVDAALLLSRIGDLCRAADVCVSDLTLIEKEAGLARLSGTADEATLDLLAAMLEAKASGRSEAAVRTLDLAEQYLRMLGVEPVLYAEGNEAYFDVLPTLAGERTIRPAMLRDGRLIRRGVAVRAMERGMGA